MPRIRIIWMVVLLMVAAGCAAQSGRSRVEEDFGTSCRLAIKNQTLNENAGQSMSLVEGMESRAAQNTYDQYLKSFDKAQKEPTYLLGIGGQGGASK